MTNTFEFPPFRFEAAPDVENPKRLRVLAYKDGEPFTDLHGAQMSKVFAPGAGLAQVERFCQRFATDDAFRTQTMLKHAFACC